MCPRPRVQHRGRAPRKLTDASEAHPDRPKLLSLQHEGCCRRWGLSALPRARLASVQAHRVALRSAHRDKHVGHPDILPVEFTQARGLGSLCLQGLRAGCTRQSLRHIACTQAVRPRDARVEQCVYMFDRSCGRVHAEVLLTRAGIVPFLVEPGVALKDASLLPPRQSAQMI